MFEILNNISYFLQCSLIFDDTFFSGNSYNLKLQLLVSLCHYNHNLQKYKGRRSPVTQNSFITRIRVPNKKRKLLVINYTVELYLPLIKK